MTTRSVGTKRATGRPTVATALTMGAVLLLAAPADAQCRGDRCRGAEARGTPALSIEIAGSPLASTFVGLWGRLGDAVDLGVEAELAYRRSDVTIAGDELTSTMRRLGVGASLKWYTAPRSTVTPFLYGHGGVTKDDTEVEQGSTTAETDATWAHVRGAIGLEWFASDRLSISGNIGVRWRSGDEERDGPLGDSEIDQETLELFTSGIGVTFRF